MEHGIPGARNMVMEAGYENIMVFSFVAPYLWAAAH
jgi:hypothetical protein